VPKLNQINAIVTARKGDAEKQITEIYKLVQKDALFAGRERTYRPLDEVNGQKLPAESQRVQQRADDLIRQAREKWTELWNLVYTQDTGNQQGSIHRAHVSSTPLGKRTISAPSRDHGLRVTAPRTRPRWRRGSPG